MRGMTALYVNRDMLHNTHKPKLPSCSAWRHWGCVTPKILAKITDAADVDGYEELRPEDQARVKTAVEAGVVSPEDVPESAKKPEGEEEERPKRAKKGSKKKDEEDGEPKEKPKRVRAKVCP